MELTTARPNSEAVQLVASSLQNTRFKERRLREAQSDVRNEAVYFSPVIRIDRETQSAIIQYRDGATGAVEREYPAPPKKGAYQDVQVDAEASKPSVEVATTDIVEVKSEEKKPPQSVDENV